MNNLNEIVQEMVDQVPGVVGVLLIDIDGIPVAVAGEFDLDPYDLGAILATCHQSYNILGEDLGQFWIESIIAEYDDLKLVQHRMPRGSLVVVAEKATPLGLIRMEAKRGIQAVTEQMQESAEAREKLVQMHKFRKPKAEGDEVSGSTNLIAHLEKNKKG